MTGQDIALAKDLLALSPSAHKNHPIHNSHGVDILLGGHDHRECIQHNTFGSMYFELQPSLQYTSLAKVLPHGRITM